MGPGRINVKRHFIAKVWYNLFYSGYHVIPLKLDHGINLFLHTAVACAVYFVFGETPISFLAAVFMSIHPTHTQVSIWLNGKRYAIISLLLLASWYFRPWGIIFYPFTFFWQIGGVLFPLLYLPQYWLFLLAIPIGLFLMRRKILEKITERMQAIPFGEVKRIRWRKLVIFAKGFGYYFLHSLLPIKPGFYQLFLESFGFGKEYDKYWYSYNGHFFRGLAVIGFVIGAIIGGWGTPIAFGLIWWVIFIIPWCHFPITCTQATSERIMYLPNIGFMLALSWGILRLPYGTYIAVVFFTYYLTRLILIIPTYRNLEEFYRHIGFFAPDHFRVNAHVAKMNLKQFKVFHAIAECSKGLHYHPNDCMLNLIMAQALLALAMWEPAKKYIDKAKANFIPGQEEKLLKVTGMFEDVIRKKARITLKEGPNAQKETTHSSQGEHIQNLDNMRKPIPQNIKGQG